MFWNNFKLLVDDVVNIKEINSFMKNKFDITLNDIRLNSHKKSKENYYTYLTPTNIKEIKEINHLPIYFL